jgi:hypothetical protein
MDLIRSRLKPPPVGRHLLPFPHHAGWPVFGVAVLTPHVRLHRQTAHKAPTKGANKAVEATPTKPLGFGYGSWLIGVGLVLHRFIVVRAGAPHLGRSAYLTRAI